MRYWSPLIRLYIQRAMWKLWPLKWFYIRRRTDLALLLLGAIAAFLLIAPFFGPVIPEATATVASAFLGAMIAVLWSASTARRERLTDHREAAIAIRLMVEEIPAELEAFCGFAQRALRDPEFYPLAVECALSLLQEIRRSAENLADLQPHLGNFGAVNLVGTLDLRRALKEICETLERYLNSDYAHNVNDQTAQLENLQGNLESTIKWLSAI